MYIYKLNSVHVNLKKKKKSQNCSIVMEYGLTKLKFLNRPDPGITAYILNFFVDVYAHMICRINFTNHFSIYNYCYDRKL